MPGVLTQRVSDLARFATDSHHAHSPAIHPLQRAPTDEDASKDGQASSWSRREDVRQRIFAWINGSTSTDGFASEAEYNDNISKWHPGTCEWLHDNVLFQDWLKVRNPPPLLITALPGSGKTVLASAITRHLRQKGFKASVFYYSVAHGRRSAESLLSALAHDLLMFADFEPNDLMDLYRTELADKHHVLDNLFIAMRVVEILLKTSDRVHIVVDGLDECQDRNKLFMVLQQLLRAKTYGVVKWLFTSRPDYKLRAKLAQSQVVEIEAPSHAIKADIQSFIRSQTSLDLYDLFKCVSDTGDELDSNFLWATKMMEACQGIIKLGEQAVTERTIAASVVGKVLVDEVDDSLSSVMSINNASGTDGEAGSDEIQMSDPAILSFLTQIMTLPRTMNSLYVRSLNALASFPADKQKVAKKLLAFVIAAEQPLRVSELAHALVTTSRVQDYSTAKLPTTALISSLGTDLITFDHSLYPDDPTVRVPHKSALEFLSTDKHTPGLLATARGFLVDTKTAQRLLGETCIQYLSHPRYRYARDIPLLLEHKDHCFLRYAATCWHKHLNVEKPNVQLLSRVQDFINSPCFWTCVAVQSYVAPYTFARYVEEDKEIRPVMGNQILPSPSTKVQWGFPLPWYLQSSTAKLFLEWVIQWHHVLNTYPDQIQHCRMEITWDHKWPEYWQWVVNARGPVRTISSLPDDADNLHVTQQTQRLRPPRLCCVTRAVLGTTSHSTTYLRPNQMATCYCAACSQALRRDGLENALVEDSTLGRIGEYVRTTKLLRERTTSTSSPLDTKWNFADYRSNIKTDKQVVRHPAMAIHWAQLDDSRRRHVQDLSKRVTVGLQLLSHADGFKRDPTSLLAVKEHCMLIYRQGLATISYFWKSDHRMLYTVCSFHPEQPWICWSPKIGQLCIARKEAATVEEVKLPEPENSDTKKAHTMYREVHFSNDGTHLWSLFFTISSEEDTGLDHILGISCFDIVAREDGEVELQVKKTVTLKYSSCGSVIAPGLFTAWTKDYVFVVMPPTASKPKIVRLSLDLSKGDKFETIIEPVYFPSTTFARRPRLLTWSTTEDEDFLVLLLASEIPRLPDTLSAASDASDQDDIQLKHGLADGSTRQGSSSVDRTSLKEMFGDVAPTDSAFRAALPEDTVLQGSHRIAWKLHRDKDWRTWSEEEDGSSDDHKLLVLTKETLNGTHIAKNRPLPVTTRCDLNWKRQAELTCG